MDSLIKNHIHLLFFLIFYGCTPLHFSDTSEPYQKPDEVVSQLRHSSWKKRLEAVLTLENLRARAAFAIPSLLRLMEDKESEVRESTIRALLLISSKAPSGIDILLQELANNKKTRSAAALILIQLKEKAHSSFVKLFGNKNKSSETLEEKWITSITLGKFGKKAIPLLLFLLKNRDENVRCWSLITLKEMKQKAKTAFPVILEALRDKNASVRREAAKALGAIGITSRHLIQTLKKRLQDKNFFVVLASATALAQLGKLSIALPLLLKALQHKNASIRADAITNLEAIRIKNRVIISALFRATKDKHEGVRFLAVSTLLSLDTRTAEAIPYFVHTLTDTNHLIRLAARTALIDLGKKVSTTIPVLLHAFKTSKSVLIKAAILQMFGKIRIWSPSLFAVLTEALRHSDISIRRNAVWALGCFGAKASKAVPFLQQALNDSSSDVKLHVKIALRKILSN